MGAGTVIPVKTSVTECVKLTQLKKEFPSQEILHQLTEFRDFRLEWIVFMWDVVTMHSKIKRIRDFSLIRKGK